MTDTTNTTSLRERLLAASKYGYSEERPHLASLLNEAAAALSPPALDAPAVGGWVLVPREPTEAMLSAWFNHGARDGRTLKLNDELREAGRGDWAAMIYASPVAAQAVTDAEVADVLAVLDGWGLVLRDRVGKKPQMRIADVAALIRRLAHPNAAPCDAQGAE